MAKTREQLKAQGHTGPVYEIGEPVPASSRGSRKTKGLPYSRCLLVGTIVRPNLPAVLVLKHPTRGTRHRVSAAKPGVLATFFPSLPENLTAALLGVQ